MSYLDVLAEIDVCVFFKQKNIFTDKSVDSVVMVGIHEPLWLYKYISSNFGKKGMKKQGDFEPVAGYLFSVIELRRGPNVCRAKRRRV